MIRLLQKRKDRYRTLSITIPVVIEDRDKIRLDSKMPFERNRIN